MLSIRVFLLLILSSHLCHTSCKAESGVKTLWQFSSKSGSLSRRLRSTELRNRRLLGIDSLEDAIIEVDVSAFSTIRSGEVFSFELPRSSKSNSKKAQQSRVELKQTCVMAQGNPLVPDSLLSKYPALRMFRCLTATGEELSLTINSNKDDGFSGVFFGKNRKTYYIDSAFESSNQYIIYDTASVNSSRKPFLEESVRRNEEFKGIEPQGRASRAVNSKSFTFEIAVIANIEYSEYHGDTVESVLAALATVFSRVNGIYARDLGVFFKFVEDMDQLFCTSNQVDRECDDLGNDYDIIDRTTDFLTARGFSSSSYDMGHAVTTGSGGLASYPSLCTRFKAQGTTGLTHPVGDVFFVDYVSHEIGHQLGGPHIFRDCGGPRDSNLMIEGAVEPGSGSSIMGYAGICGENNIQSNSDPYFNSKNLVQLQDYVESVGGIDSCGEVLSFERDLSALSFEVASCSVPIGNYFQLNSDLESADELFFNWDRVDTGYEDFSSKTEGKFRSWRPVPFTSRFFPNLYFLNFETSQSIEMLPTKEKEMTFQFTSRSSYSNNALLENFGLNQMGDFVFKTADVSFVDEDKLEIKEPSSGDEFKEGDSVKVLWESAGMGNRVKIYIAEMILHQDPNFRYDEDIDEFEWKLIGEADMEDEEAEVKIPFFTSLTSVDQISANLMIRSSSLESNDDLCFFFDLVTGIAIFTGKSSSPTTRPSFSPTQPPTEFPSSAPQTSAPSKSPTPFPTSASPTRFPSKAPTSFPTVFPTNSPTSFPTGFPTSSPTSFPTMNPTSFPTVFPTNSPTSFPTAFPTSSPTSFPTESSPTPFPSN